MAAKHTRADQITHAFLILRTCTAKKRAKISTKTEIARAQALPRLRPHEQPSFCRVELTDAKKKWASNKRKPRTREEHAQRKNKNSTEWIKFVRTIRRGRKLRNYSFRATLPFQSPESGSKPVQVPAARRRPVSTRGRATTEAFHTDATHVLEACRACSTSCIKVHAETTMNPRAPQICPQRYVNRSVPRLRLRSQRQLFQAKQPGEDLPGQSEASSNPQRATQVRCTQRLDESPWQEISLLKAQSNRQQQSGCPALANEIDRASWPSPPVPASPKKLGERERVLQSACIVGLAQKCRLNRVLSISVDFGRHSGTSHRMLPHATTTEKAIFGVCSKLTHKSDARKDRKNSTEWMEFGRKIHRGRKRKPRTGVQMALGITIWKSAHLRWTTCTYQGKGQMSSAMHKKRKN